MARVEGTDRERRQALAWALRPGGLPEALGGSLEISLDYVQEVQDTQEVQEVQGTAPEPKHRRGVPPGSGPGASSRRPPESRGRFLRGQPGPGRWLGLRAPAGSAARLRPGCFALKASGKLWAVLRRSAWTGTVARVEGTGRERCRAPTWVFRLGGLREAVGGSLEISLGRNGGQGRQHQQGAPPGSGLDALP